MIAQKNIPNFENTEIAFSHKSNWQLKKAYGLFKLFSFQPLVNIGAQLTEKALQLKLPINGLVKHTIFEQFCGGENLADCKKTIAQLASFNIDTILDYGVEAKQSEAEYEATLQHQLQAIAYAKNNKHISVVAAKVTGMARFSLLEKMNAGKALTESENNEATKVASRLHQLATAAHEAQVQLYFDAEETWIQKPIDNWIENLMAQFNTKSPVIFNTIQLYCKDRLAHLLDAHDKAKQEGYIYGAKLVRGAYMEKERARALQKNYASPIHKNKELVDRDYNAAIDYCLNHIDSIAFCCGSHNEYSNQYLAAKMQEKNIPLQHPHITFAQLYGMSENLTFNLAHSGYRTAKWIPYGTIKEVIPYLTRRAQENSSATGQMSRELLLLKKEMARRGL